MSHVIAIDGPSGAGKSSVSRLVGQRLGYLHVDSGALYRIMTWQCLENGVDTSNPEAVAAFAATVAVECRPEAGAVAYFVKGEKPGNRIRTPEINAHASSVATVKAVRDRITAILRGLTAHGNLVVEGRDITTAVFPDTPARFYLTASAEARARRRQREEVAKGIANQSEAAVKASLLARDAIDSTRKYAPLRKADGVLEIDSSDLTLDQVVETVLAALPADWRATGCLKLNLDSIRNQADAWAAAHVTLPTFDIAAVRAQTQQTPEWVHFGAGNIFRGFIGSLNQRLLNEGLAKTGIIACETFDADVIDRIYTPFDSLTLNVLLNPDGTTTREVLAGVAEGLKANFADPASAARLKAIFRAPSLKMLSFTITEKGYALRTPDGAYLPVVAADLKDGPATARHAMAIVCALLWERFNAGRLPLAVVSMDNCSHNGEKLKAAVVEIAEAWRANGFVTDAFLAYLDDASTVAFPWSMIDKITPRPHPQVEASLAADGLADMAPIVTSKKTFIAPFVNAERSQYLVVEDAFPNGRPPLEKAGVYFCDRATVNKTETMKVTTCLNPLHTAMSVYGCLLGYTLICEEMKDADIVRLVRRLGYVEGLPVVVDPKILSPKAFLDEVVTARLPNPFMPDDPRRIATDTSQKVGIRFGETVKSSIAAGRDLNELIAIPLALAGWFRYLLAVDDAGKPIEVSPDPLKDELQAALKGIVWNDPASYKGELRPLLANAALFHVDYTQTPLADRIEGYFKRLLEGPGAARRILRAELA